MSADDFLGMVEIDLQKQFHAGWGHGWTKPKEWPLVDSRNGDLQILADRSVKKQIKKRRATGVHPFGFMRLKMQFIADVPPAPIKLAIQASETAQLGTELPVGIYVADASGWKPEPLHLSLDVIPSATKYLPPTGTAEVASQPTDTAARNLAELRGMMAIGGLARAHSRWMSVLEPSSTKDTFLRPASTEADGLGPAKDDDTNAPGSYEADLEGGSRASSRDPSVALVPLPGTVSEETNFGRSGVLSLKQTTSLAASALRVKRKIKVKKSRGDATTRAPVQVALQ